jgi:site-specific DNA recombinase
VKRAAIYARVSSDEQAGSDRYSLPTQVSDIADYCVSNGYEIVATYREDESGLIFDGRPELRNLLEAGAAGQFDTVVSLCPDRLARGITSFTLTAGALDEIGVKYEFVQGGALDESPESRLTLEIAAVISGYEAKKIRERAVRGRKGRAKAGGYVKGRVIPFGYSYIPKSATSKGELVINPEEAEIVRMIFSWYVNDRLGSVKIANRLSDMGVKRRGTKNGKQHYRGETDWNSPTVIKMIKNETYAGIFRFGKRKVTGHKMVNGRRIAVTEKSLEKTVDVPVPAIIDHELWEKAQRLLVANKITSTRNTKHIYLMQGRLRCAECGSTFHARVLNDKLKDGTEVAYPYYRCTGAQRHISTSGVHDKCRGYIRADLADGMAWDSIQDFFAHPDFVVQQIEKQHANKAEIISRKQTEFKHLATQLAKVKDKLSLLLDLYLDRKMDKEEYASQKSLLTTQENELTVSAGKLEELIAGLTPDLSAVSRFLQYVEWFNTLGDLNLLQRKQIVHDVNFTGVVTRDGKGEFYIDFTGFAPDNLPFENTTISHGSIRIANATNGRVGTSRPSSPS